MKYQWETSWWRNKGFLWHFNLKDFFYSFIGCFHKTTWASKPGEIHSSWWLSLGKKQKSEYKASMTWNYYTSISPQQVQLVGEKQTQRQKNMVALAPNASFASSAHCQDLTAPAQTNSMEKLNKGTQHPAKKKNHPGSLVCSSCSAPLQQYKTAVNLV